MGPGQGPWEEGPLRARWALGLLRGPSGGALQGEMAMRMGGGLRLGEVNTMEEGKEGAMQWATWVSTLRDPSWWGDAHSYHT